MIARRTALSLVIALFVLASAASAQIVRESVPELEGVAIADKVGTTIPLDAPFLNAKGEPVTLGDYFDGERPVLLVPIYFDCPVLCGQTQSRVLQALNQMDWVAGEDFRVVCFSFDHTEGPVKARTTQERRLAGYNKPWTDAGETWAYLTTRSAENAKRVCSEIGFYYRFVPRAGEYSHGAVVYFITPEGVIHNYIEGLDFTGEDLQTGLREARDGEQRSIFQSAFAWCFHYDPESGKVTTRWWRVMSVAASLGALMLFGVIGVLVWRTGRRAERERAQRIADERGGAE